MDILVVIPARGGSKGIPRKNLRLLNGKPLLSYAIETAKASAYSLDIYVSSDDDEILSTAGQFGATQHKRDKAIACDETTLDPVIYATYRYAQEREGREYDYIITMQPTSPLLSTDSLDRAIAMVVDDRTIETVIAAKEDTHLSWRREGKGFVPNYHKRVNRQYLPATFRETGAFFITRADIITPSNRIGKRVELFLLSQGEEIDIDTYEDWNLCEYHLKRKHICFVVTGNHSVGLGHVYNTLLIANDILNHQITFLVDRKSQLAYDKIASKNYPVVMQSQEEIIEDIKRLAPDLVINDRLDSTRHAIESLKAEGFGVINFEDLGEGAKYADMVVNAIYPEQHVLPNHYFGHPYFILRDEFIYAPTKTITSRVSQVLITFGGVDPNNYTRKVIAAIEPFCQAHQIKITVIAGFGYTQYASLEAYPSVEVLKNVTNISHYMLEADIVFTSAGRTTYEIASIGTPAIVLAQNEREMTHFFASSQFGFLNLGLGYHLSESSIAQHFSELVANPTQRNQMHRLMLEVDLKHGRERVNQLIQNILEKR